MRHRIIRPVLFLYILLVYILIDSVERSTVITVFKNVLKYLARGPRVLEDY